VSKNKRSEISPERLTRLTKPNVLYVISCYDDEYFCDNHFEGCSRGFFSLYIQAVYGIYFARRVGIPYYIDFGNVSYFYSSPERFNNDRNFWNYHFEQNPIAPNAVCVLNTRYENYPLRVWNRGYARGLNDRAVSQLVLKKEFKQEIDQIRAQFFGLKVLGIHIRRTDHFLEINQSGITAYFKAVERRIDKFDKIFLATDDETVLGEFLLRYPGKVIYNAVYRSSGIVPVHANKTIEDRYRLGKDALLDCYSLSICNRAILSPSNFSYAAFLINPNLEYEIIESWHARRIRWKTLIVFYLDKWKIRKW